MSPFLDALGRAPPLLAQHLLLAFAALLLGIAISLPLAVWSARRPGVARVTLAEDSRTRRGETVRVKVKTRLRW